MAKCPHCQSEVLKVSEQQHYCTFCDMAVIVKDQVKPFELRGAVDHVDAAKSTKDLLLYHSFDLLLLLRFCRQERRDTYQLMQAIGQVKKQSKEFAEAYKEAYSQYDYWTKKARIAESLVKERIGFVPKAVSNELLDRFYSVFQETKDLAAAM